MKESHFLAIVSRMKYIDRWALMRNSRTENLSEHSLEVAMIAHALCVIANVRYGETLNPEKAALAAMYHDSSEIITGDMPTPVKYLNDEIRGAYKQVEKKAEAQLLDQLPDDLRKCYEEIYNTDQKTERYVKAADKLSALIKCIEEESAGNTEFRNAAQSTKRSLEEMKKDIPALNDFMEELLPSYGRTLDELLGRAI